jgi:hypothetical protein
MTQFASLTYYTYNSPSYFAGVILLIMFSIFYAMLYLALKYETYNNMDYCDPMYYYGQACKNEINKSIVTNTEFAQAKSAFHDKVAKYDASISAYKGIQSKTEDDQKEIHNANEAINKNVEANTTFPENTIDEINEITDFTKMLSSKYLGDVQTLISSVTSKNPAVEDQLKTIPEQIGILKQQINTAIVTPALTRYSAPLHKLYKSLTDMTLDTNEYVPTTAPPSST